MITKSKDLKENSFDIWAFDLYKNIKKNRTELMFVMSKEQWEKYSDFEQEIGIESGYLPIKYGKDFFDISWYEWGYDNDHILYVYKYRYTTPINYYELKDKKLIFKGDIKKFKDEKDV